MLLGMNGIVCPKEYEHDPNIVNDHGDTVAIILAGKGVIPPK